MLEVTPYLITLAVIVVVFVLALKYGGRDGG